MAEPPVFISGAVRTAAVGLGGVAIAMLLQHGTAKRPSAPVIETAMDESAAATAAGAGAGAWSLRAGGWYIRVDGVEVAAPSVTNLVPSLTQQTGPNVSPATRLSPFDHLIAYHAKAEGFDWRLIAALIFEESRFDPFSRSDRGAYGLMQVRPIAAEAVGAHQFKAPDDNIKTGVRYLRRLDEMFRTASSRDRLCLVLAAYNMGPGHLRDAQTLARRYGYDPDRWDEALELMLPLLEEAAIYQHLPNGFAKGRQTVAHVQRILDRYQRYQRETAGSSPDTGSEALSSFSASS